MKQFFVICCLMSWGLYGQFEWKPDGNDTVGFYRNGKSIKFPLPDGAVITKHENKPALTGKDQQGLMSKLSEM